MSFWKIICRLVNRYCVKNIIYSLIVILLLLNSSRFSLQLGHSSIYYIFHIVYTAHFVILDVLYYSRYTLNELKQFPYLMSLYILLYFTIRPLI